MAFPGLDTSRTIWLDLSESGLTDEAVSLVADETGEFEAVLGCRVRVGPPRASDAAWLVRRPAAPGSPPALAWCADESALVSYADDATQVLATFNLLHDLARSARTRVAEQVPHSPAAAFRVIRDATLGSFPSFELRGIAASRWADRKVEDVPTTWEDFVPWAQEWVAELSDAHTAVLDLGRRGQSPPWGGRLGPEGLTLEWVAESSAAHDAGVRSGWVVDVDDPQTWMRTTGASPVHHRQVAARRAVTIVGAGREFSAREPGSGRRVEWYEPRRERCLRDLLTVHRDAEAVTVRLHAFDDQIPFDEIFDELCGSSTSEHHLVLDLRGNTGGSLAAATALRGRFLRERTWIGSAAFTNGRGVLAPAQM